ncbi:MAG: EAL domain-containing protein [Rhodocyclaceae bacterium]|nr:EAL domain-containing protein [Rhodocyclaceae bacterium]
MDVRNSPPGASAPPELGAVRRAFEPVGGADEIHWEADGHAVGTFHRARLSSVFQPIVDLRTHEVVAHEALIRCHKGNDLSPWGLFSLASDPQNLVSLDRLCRTVHALNYFAAAGATARLHLNIHTSLLETVPTDHGRVFSHILACLGVGPERVVVEFHESANRAPDLLKGAALNFCRRGFGLCLSYGGEKYPWLRALPVPEGTLIRIVPGRLAGGVALDSLVEACRRHGFVPLLHHVETAGDRARAIAAGARLGQGFLFGRPDKLPGHNLPVLPEAGLIPAAD